MLTKKTCWTNTWTCLGITNTLIIARASFRSDFFIVKKKQSMISRGLSFTELPCVEMKIAKKLRTRRNCCLETTWNEKYLNDDHMTYTMKDIFQYWCDFSGKCIRLLFFFVDIFIAASINYEGLTWCRSNFSRTKKHENISLVNIVSKYFYQIQFSYFCLDLKSCGRARSRCLINRKYYV